MLETNFKLNRMESELRKSKRKFFKELIDKVIEPNSSMEDTEYIYTKFLNDSFEICKLNDINLYKEETSFKIILKISDEFRIAMKYLLTVYPVKYLYSDSIFPMYLNKLSKL